jgi:primosomal replication protein N
MLRKILLEAPAFRSEGRAFHRLNSPSSLPQHIAFVLLFSSAQLDAQLAVQVAVQLAAQLAAHLARQRRSAMTRWAAKWTLKAFMESAKATGAGPSKGVSSERASMA